MTCLVENSYLNARRRTAGIRGKHPSEELTSFCLCYTRVGENCQNPARLVLYNRVFLVWDWLKFLGLKKNIRKTKPVKFSWRDTPWQEGIGTHIIRESGLSLWMWGPRRESNPSNICQCPNNELIVDKIVLIHKELYSIINKSINKFSFLRRGMGKFAGYVLIDSDPVLIAWCQPVPRYY